MRHHLQILTANTVNIRCLHQQPTSHTFQFKAIRTCQQRHFQHAHIFLSSDNLFCLIGKLRCHQHFQKLPCYRFHRIRIHLTVKRNNTAKCTGRIRCKCQLIRIQRRIRYRHTTRIRMFHNHTSWLIKRLHRFPCCIRIRNIVIRQLLAL